MFDVSATRHFDVSKTPESEKVATQMLLSVVDYIGWRLIRGDFKGFQKLSKQDTTAPLIASWGASMIPRIPAPSRATLLL